MACVPDRYSAKREVAQAYELIKSHQPRLQFDDVLQLSATTNLAQSLLNDAMRALHLALCVMNPQISAHCGAESSSRSNRPHLFSPSAEAGDVGRITSQQKKGKRRRANEETSRVILTEAPHTDGSVWRKYGEKKINGTHFKRHYFRCSYKYDRGSQATKQIQQQSSNDLPMFQVTYNSEHTCNCTTAANKYIKSDLPQRSSCDNNGTISQMGDAMISESNKPLVGSTTSCLLCLSDKDNDDQLAAIGCDGKGSLNRLELANSSKDPSLITKEEDLKLPSDEKDIVHELQIQATIKDNEPIKIPEVTWGQMDFSPSDQGPISSAVLDE
nr:probable WRKY transcription factor 54 [Setaria viridis]